MKPVKWILMASLALAAWIGSTLAAMQLLLPTTACTVSETQISHLKLESMSYADVRRVFGCDGKLAARQDYGEIVVETFAWRGNAWPYGAFEGEFINGTLHGTRKTWLTLAVNLPN